MIPIKFTLCFIHHDQQILMLHRKKEPNKGKWNGVGGKIEANEHPEAACRREILEETGLEINQLTYRGVVYWNNEGGMYVFFADSPSLQFQACDEGKLEWKPLSWVMSDPTVVSNIPLFLKEMLDIEKPPRQHSFFYNEHGEIIQQTLEDLPRELYI